MRVVIVDDHKHFREAFRTVLGSFEFIESIDEAGNGAEYLDIISNTVPDVVFMDIEMPEVNGVEATKRTLDHFRDIIIVALSYHKEFEYVKSMIEAGARNYIVKDEINEDALQKIFDSVKRIKN